MGLDRIDVSDEVLASMDVPIEVFETFAREDASGARTLWERYMGAKRKDAEEGWVADDRPRVSFRQDFSGNLYMLAGNEAAPAWIVTVHPGPGIARNPLAQIPDEVSWYDEPPSEATACWFVYFRDCFIELRIPRHEHPYWIRRTQPSFGRFRVRRNPLMTPASTEGNR